ncbi:MAG: hypothetical protein K0R54_562 [Clostridiaceae bacterium]|jgi:hypothetical protein|nr:hypothetical protein [Clostridiaceae bacterium]
MEISINNFVFLMIQKLIILPYMYENTIRGCISEMIVNEGYICNATDDEIYAKFKEDFNKVKNCVNY